MNRREFLRLIATGVGGTLAGAQLDLEELLWVPGKKTIFLPSLSPTITMSQIVAIEMERIAPKLKTLFERDDMFYRIMRSKQ